MAVAIEENFKDALVNSSERLLGKSEAVWNGRSLSRDGADSPVAKQALKGAPLDDAQNLLKRNVVDAKDAVHLGKVVAVAVGVVVVETEVKGSLADQFKAGTLQQKVSRKEIDPHTLIHKAILENNSVVVDFLIRQGVDVNYPDENGMTPLTIALLNRCSNVVEVLLSRGADVNPKVKWNNMTLLELAFFMKDWTSAKKLIRHPGVDLDIYVGEDPYPINKTGRREDGYFLLSRSLENAYRYIQLGQKQDFIDFFDIAKNMVAHGATIRALDVHFAARIAAFYDDFSLLELMAKRNVDFNSFKNFYLPPIVIAASDFNKNNGLIKWLITAGVNVNQSFILHSKATPITALMMAIRGGSLEKVKLLVEFGANVNQPAGGHDGKLVSPIKYALDRQLPEIVQYLLQHGART